MRGVGEDGATFEEVPIESINTSNADVSTEYENGTARINASEDVTGLGFDGVSSPVVQEEDDLVVGETQLEIRAEVRSPEDE